MTAPDMDGVRSKAEAGDASAEYELGRSMLSERPTDSEFASAMPWFRRSAEQGDATAEYMYGLVFREGRWKDPKQLVYWWTKAAEQGNVNAQLWLGALYEQGRYGIEQRLCRSLQVALHGGETGPARRAVHTWTDVRIRRRSSTGLWVGGI